MNIYRAVECINEYFKKKTQIEIYANFIVPYF